MVEKEFISMASMNCWIYEEYWKRCYHFLIQMMEKNIRPNFNSMEEQGIVLELMNMKIKKKLLKWYFNSYH